MYVAALFIIAEAYNSKGRVTQVSIHLGMDKMWCVHTMEYYSDKKEWSTDTYYNVDEPWEHGKWKNPVTKATYWRIHLYEVSRVGKPIEIESRCVAARAEGEQKWGVTANSFGVMKVVWN